MRTVTNVYGLRVRVRVCVYTRLQCIIRTIKHDFSCFM
jgi:hypothetical protein